MATLDQQLEEVAGLVRQKHQQGRHDQSAHTPKKYGKGGAGDTLAGPQHAAERKDKQVRRALAEAFTGMGDSLKKSEVAYINYRRRKNSIYMEDEQGWLGNMAVTMNAGRTQEMFDLSLDEVETYLKDNGAQKIKPKKRRRPSYSYYD